MVAASAFRAPSLDAVADLLLPIGAFAETSGTFVNAGGVWQCFQGAVAPPGEARPGWKVLRVLGNLLDLPGFEYPRSAQVRAELSGLCADCQAEQCPGGRPQGGARGAGEGLIRVGQRPALCGGLPGPALAGPAADTRHGGRLRASICIPTRPAAADCRRGSVEIRQNGSAVSARSMIDDSVRPGSARIPAGVAGSEALGEQIGPVQITRVSGNPAQGADPMIELWNALPVVMQILLKIIVILLPLMGLVAYYT